MIDELKQIPLFAGLDDATLRSLADLATLRQYRANTFVLGQDERSDAIYFICSGKVRVFRDNQHGNEVTVNVLQGGQYFGEFALLADEPRVANVQTLAPTSVVIVSRGAFMTCFGDNPAVAWQMCRDVIAKARAATFNVSNLALLDIAARVGKVLQRHAHQDNDQWVVDNLTHQEIAHHVGASRETVSRTMKELRAKGFVRNEGRRIVLLKPIEDA